MEEKNLEFRVGLFIFIGLLCLAAMIISFGIEGFHLKKDTFTIAAVFKYTSGVIVGAPVRNAGVEVGKVINISFKPENDNDVRVEMEIKNGTVIRTDSRVIINSLGIIGEKYIEFIPMSTTAKIMINGDTINGESPSTMDDLMKEGKGILEDVRTAIKKLIDDENVANIKKIIENINNIAEKDVAEIKNEIKKSLEEFNVSMRSMQKALDSISEIIGQNKEKLSLSIDEIGNAFENISNAMNDFQKITIGISTVISDIKDGKGTIGKLIVEKQLYEDFSTFVAKLNTVMELIKEKGLLFKPEKKKNK